MQREQETLNSNFSETILKEVSEAEVNQDEIKLEVKSKPIVENDESFANLATRIVDEVITNRSPKSLAKQVLEQVGINHDKNVGEPKVFNGHLRHVGQVRQVRRHVRHVTHVTQEEVAGRACPLGA